MGHQGKKTPAGIQMAGNPSVVGKDGIFQALCGPYHSTLNVHTPEEVYAPCACFACFSEPSTKPGSPQWCLTEGIPAKGQSLCRLAPNPKLPAVDLSLGLCLQAYLSLWCQERDLGVVPKAHPNKGTREQVTNAAS